MKLLCAVGGLVSLVLVATGFFWIWKLGLLGSGMDICVTAFPAGLSLSLGLYVLHLRGRISTLEKTLRESK